MAVNNKTRSIKIAFAFCLCFVVANSQAAIIPRLEQGQNLNIAAIGTSLTAPVGVQGRGGQGRWFEAMGTWLNTLPYTGKVTLDNEAVGGALSQSVAVLPGSQTLNGLSPGNPVTLAPGQLELALNNPTNKPDAVFIEFGVNDAGVNADRFPIFGITPEMLRNNLQTMIDQINTWSSVNKPNNPVDIVIMTMNDVSGTSRPNLDDYYDSCRNAAGCDGSSSDPAIRKLRLRQACNLHGG